MICPPDVLCKWLKEEGRYETMEELAINIERERNGLPPRVLNSRRVTAAQEAARLERWIKRVPSPVAPVQPPPSPRRKHVRKATPLSMMEQMVEEFRRSLIKTVIASEGGNQCKAAKVLGVHRNTINRIINSRMSA